MNISAFFIAFKKTTSEVLDYIFPRFCVSCKKEGMWLCSKCLPEVQICKIQKCPYCDLSETQGITCHSHTEKHLDKLFSGSYYTEKTVQKLIRLYKYKYIKDISKDLFKILQKSAPKSFITKADAVSFVPLHRIKYNKRGFNQAEILARHISKKYNLPLHKILKRKRNTKPQAEITKTATRKKNLQNAFKMHKKATIENKNILLIDDVYTSGTTLNECAKVLKQNGAQKVYGLVIARRHKIH